MEKREKLEESLKTKADMYCDRYDENMQVLESSLLAKAKGGLDPYDYFALGKQLEQFDEYVDFCEEEGNLNQLGKIPNIAHSVITATHGTAIHNIIASIQPVEEEQGLVYFEQLRAANTKGNNTAGDLLVDPRTGLKTSQSYASNKVVGEVLVATAAATLNYQATPAVAPVRSQTLKIYLASSPNTVYGQDVGPQEGQDPNIGIILGRGMSGTINYATGLVDVTLAADAGVDALHVDYQQNYELSTDLPQIQPFLDSKQVQAEIHALKGVTSMLKNFAIRKRFGMSAEDDLSRKLVQEINREIGGSMIKKLVNAAQGLTTFDKTPPSAVPYTDHKQTLADKFADAESVMIGNAGRGSISHAVVGREMAAIISTLPDFVKLSDGNSLGAHVFGTWQGKVIVRVNEQAILDSKTAVGIYKGSNPFEAACVYTPYMPLAITSTLPLGPNPLSNQKAAAVWAGTDVMVENYATKIQMVIS